VVISGPDAVRMREAQRVATVAVIVGQAANPTASLFVERLSRGRANERFSVCLIVDRGDVDLPVKHRLQLLEETIPAGLDHQVLLHRLNASKTPDFKNKAKGDVVIFIGSQVQPIPGWLPPLLRLFAEKPDAGVVGGRLINFDGTQNHIGAIAGRGGALELLGADEVDPASPGFGFVRELDCCATTFLAVRRSLVGSCGIPRNFGGDDVAATAAFCSAVRAEGRRVYFEPDCCAISFAPAPAARSTDTTDVGRRGRRLIGRSRAHDPSRNGSEVIDQL
jgi:hypothetical protein